MQPYKLVIDRGGITFYPHKNLAEVQPVGRDMKLVVYPDLEYHLQEMLSAATTDEDREWCEYAMDLVAEAVGKLQSQYRSSIKKARELLGEDEERLQAYLDEKHRQLVFKLQLEDLYKFSSWNNGRGYRV